MSDEDWNYRVIEKTAAFHLVLDMAKLPGYVISVGAIEHFFGHSRQNARLVSTIFALISVLIFYFVAKRLDPKVASIKTLQYFFFPILFIFFFLIYSDVYSLLFVLITFLLVLKRKYFWAGFFGFLSLLIRQNNLIWLGFFCIYILFDKYNLSINFVNLKRYFKDISLFIFSFFLSAIFILVNKSAVIAEPEMHPLSFHLDNIFFLLFLFFFLFLPLNLGNLPKIIRLLKSNRETFLLLTLLLIDIFLLYFLTFKADHPYNSLTRGSFLRNILLNYFVENSIRKSIFFLPMGYSILSLWVTPLVNKKYYLIYPFAFIFLSMLWLIEQRYYLIPFALFILFKKSQSFLIEFFTLIIFIILAGIIFSVILSRKYFL